MATYANWQCGDSQKILVCGFESHRGYQMSNLRKDIEIAINKHSAEGGSDTPDFILAEYLIDCLAAYDKATVARETWYGRMQIIALEESILPLHLQPSSTC
jgi:hypothetical protein